MTNIPVSKILPNPDQPRTHFDKAKLQELADSIREHGLVQPIVVEPGKDGVFTLIAGERRLRACKLLGLKTIEANIRERTNHNGRERLLSAIIENVQREDMDPIETARSYAHLRDEFKMSVQEIAQKTGKSTTMIYNSLVLLDTEPEIQQLLAEHKISHEPRVVNAILTVQAGSKRVQLVKTLAQRRATGKMITAACKRFNEMLEAKKTNGRNTPANYVMTTLRKNLPKWDVLVQLGKVPPFPVLNQSVLQTCNACALRPMASKAVCSDCPLVAALRGLEEVVDGRS